MSEKYSLRNVNRAAIAGGAFVLACAAVANQAKTDTTPEEPYEHLPDTTYAVTKDCGKDSQAYQSFTLNGMQRLYVTAGLRQGRLQNHDVVAIDGTAREMTVTPYGQEGRLVFPDRLAEDSVQTFPFPVLGTVAIGRMEGNADPSVILACDINALTQPGQPLEGQVIAEMPPMQ